MTMKYTLLLLLALSALSAGAQTRQRRYKPHAADTVPQLVTAYADSLLAKRTAIDSTFAAADSLHDRTLDGKYYRLFVPLTFYHDVAAYALGTGAHDGSDPSAPALLGIYLHRPDLVSATQSQIDKAGPVMQPHEEAVAPDIDIIGKVEPKVGDENIYSPIKIHVEKPNFWNFSGDYTLQIFQNYVSDNWYKGGESNYSMLATATLQANYNNKQKLRWDNKLEMRLGLQNSRGDTLHTVRASEDLIRYTGKIGIQATKSWYYTLQLITSTQFMRGLRSNDSNVYSKFLAPLYVNPSLGMNYNANWLKGKLKGSVHLAPIAYSLTYVRDKALATRFGIDEGKHTKSDFGSEVTVDLKWQMSKDISWKTRLYGYTTYKRMLVEWENTLTFVVNKYISSNLFIYPRFDDGATKDDKHGYWQLKEYVSLGFNFGF